MTLGSNGEEPTPPGHIIIRGKVEGVATACLTLVDESSRTTVSVAAGTSDSSVGFLKGTSSPILGLKMAPKPCIVRWVSAPEPAHGSYCSRDATIVNNVSPLDAIRDRSQGEASQTFRILRPYAPTLRTDGAANCISVTRSASSRWMLMGRGPRFCGICSSRRGRLLAGRVQSGYRRLEEHFSY